MVRYDRIWELCEATGKKRSYLSKAMGHSERYLLDARKQNTNIKPEELAILAEELGTTVDYLSGVSDELSGESGMFWENFINLCSENGTSPNAVAAKLGKSSGSVTSWKGGTVPRETTLIKIADYFGVSVNELFEGKRQKNTPSSGFNYDRLEHLISASGKTKTHLCRMMGKPSYYLRDVLKQKNAIPEKLQEILADELGTTVAYLNGGEDQQNSPPSGVLMGTLYENIKALCDEAGIKGGKMCVDLGISKSTMTDLKSGRRTGISLETAQKIADYFGVSVNELLEGRRQQNSPPSDEDGLTEEQAEIVRLYDAAPLSLRAAALAVLKAAEEKRPILDEAVTGGQTPRLRNDGSNA